MIGLFVGAAYEDARQADARFQDSHQLNRFTASFTRPLLLK